MHIAGIAVGILIIYLYMIAPRFSRRDDMQKYIGMMWAHRGLHCIERGIPENSMAAFKNAVKAGYGIELDVHLTKDKQLVVFHDDTLNRVCGRSGKVEEMTIRELKSYYLSGTAERIPLLSELLTYVNGRVPLLIEAKLASENPEICRYLVKELNRYQGDFLIQSFNCVVLRWLKKNQPGILRGQLAANLAKSGKNAYYILQWCIRYLLTNCFCRPDFIAYKWADRKNISLCLVQHLFKSPVAVWTVRNEEIKEKAQKQYDMLIFEENKNC